MAVVACGSCGWSQEVDEDLPLETIELKAEKAYAEHMLEVHPDMARNDAVVQKYVRSVAAVVAPTNGVVVKKRD